MILLPSKRPDIANIDIKTITYQTDVYPNISIPPSSPYFSSEAAYAITKIIVALQRLTEQSKHFFNDVLKSLEETQKGDRAVVYKAMQELFESNQLSIQLRQTADNRKTRLGYEHLSDHMELRGHMGPDQTKALRNMIINCSFFRLRYQVSYSELLMYHFNNDGSTHQFGLEKDTLHMATESMKLRAQRNSKTLTTMLNKVAGDFCKLYKKACGLWENLIDANKHIDPVDSMALALCETDSDELEDRLWEEGGPLGNVVLSLLSLLFDYSRSRFGLNADLVQVCSTSRQDSCLPYVGSVHIGHFDDINQMIITKAIREIKACAAEITDEQRHDLIVDIANKHI